MGTLVISVDPSTPDTRIGRTARQGRKWEALLKRKPLYPTFAKACRKAEGTIPPLEEFNQLWPPEREKVVYVGVRTEQEERYMEDWITRQSADPLLSEEPIP